MLSAPNPDEEASLLVAKMALVASGSFSASVPFVKGEVGRRPLRLLLLILDFKLD
jgi:hypothetical protein